jgi:nitrate reductase gamma subunit
MHTLEIFLYIVFPYLCLTVFTIGHAYRYIVDRYNWTARSSEFLEKRTLRLGSILFHWGILLTLVGHAGGLLIPQRIFDSVGISAQSHLAIAYWTGLAAGLAAFAGALLLLRRRLTNARVRAVNTVNDTVTIGALVLVIGAGLFNVAFGHYNVLPTLAPWIRSILTLTPDATLMRDVPLSYKIHLLGALALLGFSPFSRLVHIWSAPLFYFFRSRIVYRRLTPGPAGAPTAINPAPGGKE